MKTSLRLIATASAVALLLALQACETRSISNSGYGASAGGGADQYSRGRDNPFYKGELSEFDVLGIERVEKNVDGEIAQALDAHKPISLGKGTAVMLVQSGAAMPDQPMVDALAPMYRVGIFGGQPPGNSGQPGSASYSDTLRLACARGGYEKLMVYWGTLESGQENLTTRNVSWIPIVGWSLPDQRQRMRIRLKIAMIDVRTGSWDMFAPEAFEDQAFSSMMKREASDQSQVDVLKRKAYAAAAQAVATRYGQ